MKRRAAGPSLLLALVTLGTACGGQEPTPEQTPPAAAPAGAAPPASAARPVGAAPGAASRRTIDGIQAVLARARRRYGDDLVNWVLAREATITSMLGQ